MPRIDELVKLHLQDRCLRFDQALLSDDDVASLLAWPDLASIHRLELVATALAPEQLEALLKCLPHLSGLVIEDAVERDGLLAVLAATRLPELIDLRLDHVHPQLDAEAVGALLALPEIGRLDHLSLGGSIAGSPAGNGNTPASSAFAALCGHAGPYPRTLSLRYLVGDAEAVALSSSPWLAHVERLDLSGGVIYSFGFYHLFPALRGKAVRHVDVSENWMHADVIEGYVLEVAQHWDELRSEAGPDVEIVAPSFDGRR